MKKYLYLLLLLFVSSAALADQTVNPDVIFGSGNANGYFTVGTSDDGSVELGLRAKKAYAGVYNSNGSGTYTFTDLSTIWNVEWSINTDVNGDTGRKLDDLTYVTTISSSKGVLLAGADYINLPTGYFLDHSIGNNSTLNGGGVEATDAASYTALIGSNNVLQQSWRPEWFAGISSYDRSENETYNFTLSAYDGNNVVASTGITVIAGTGAVVPAPGAMLLASMGTLIAGRFRRRV